MAAAAAVGGGGNACGICFDHYNDRAKKPKALRCGHTFCEQCIQRITDALRQVRLVCFAVVAF